MKGEVIYIPAGFLAGWFLESKWTALRVRNVLEAVQAVCRAAEAVEQSGKLLTTDSEKYQEAQACAKAMYDWQIHKRIEAIENRLFKNPPTKE